MAIPMAAIALPIFAAISIVIWKPKILNASAFSGGGVMGVESGIKSAEKVSEITRRSIADCFQNVFINYIPF